MKLLVKASSTKERPKDLLDKGCMNISEIYITKSYTIQHLCLDSSLVQDTSKKMEFSVLHRMRDGSNKMIQKAAEAMNYSTFGHSPPYTMQALIYLCKVVSSYCTPNPGATYEWNWFVTSHCIEQDLSQAFCSLLLYFYSA